MKEFIDLTGLKDSGIIVLDNIPIDTVKPGDQVIDGVIKDSEILNIPKDDNFIEIEPLPKQETKEESLEDHIYVKDSCDASNNYGDTSEQGAFLKENLFSELTDEYQREIARQNLGIATEYALIWGNIKGNLLNQKDLIKFTQDGTIDGFNKIIEEINLKLSQWGYDINQSLESKVPKDSPSFTGIPTVPTPSLTDNSLTIPNTNWVQTLLDATKLDSNLQYYTISKESASIEEIPLTITLNWEYLNKVEKQWLNDKELDIDLRTFTIDNIMQNQAFVLKWQYNGVIESKTLQVQIITPFYFGTSANYEQCSNTIKKILTVNAEEQDYIYIFIPRINHITMSVNGIEGGFRNIGYKNIHNIKYYVYKSDNKNLGLTQVKLIYNDE